MMRTTAWPTACASSSTRSEGGAAPWLGGCRGEECAASAPTPRPGALVRSPMAAWQLMYVVVPWHRCPAKPTQTPLLSQPQRVLLRLQHAPPLGGAGEHPRADHRCVRAYAAKLLGAKHGSQSWSSTWHSRTAKFTLLQANARSCADPVRAPPCRASVLRASTRHRVRGHQGRD